MNNINKTPLQRSRNNFMSWLSIIFSVWLLAIPQVALAELTQSIDRTDIHAGESFLLTIQIDQDTGAEPDLSVIPKDFTIISNSQYQQMSYVNGRSNTIKGWKLKLSTLKTGNIQIPSIPVGSAATKPITLFIKDTSNRVDLGEQKKAIFLEATSDRDNSYVQQQIIFTVKLYRAVNTHYARLSEPTAGDSIIEKLGDDVQYDKRIDGTRYVVTERRYALFPQQSGELTIDPINFTADVNDPNSRGSNRFLNTTRPVSVNSKPIKVAVQPQPTKATNPWMPASEVVLADKWSNPDLTLTVGEPVTWTILLYAQGLSESQLPEIKLPKIDGLQFYPDTPQKERQVNEKGILGQRIEKLAVIPSKVGTLTLPAIEMKWWDVASNSEKTAILASKTLQVLPGAASSDVSKPAEKIAPVTEPAIKIDSGNSLVWKALTALLSVLWLITLFAYFKRPTTIKTTRHKKNNKRIRAADLVAPMTKSEVYRQLQKAIKTQQFEQIEQYLIQWTSHLAQQPIHSLGVLRGLLNNSSIKDKLTNLESHRYSNNQPDFQCDLSKSDLDEIGEALIIRSSANGDSIPPLYS
ncbi:MAG: BatD family protein [Kangiellaceae bacterium]|nr:BatD family protein [Kangiellaceae bacterium]